MKAIIRVLDEINVQLLYVSPEHMNLLVEATKIFIPKARHSAAYKLKKWDGKESNINKNGKTFVYMLPVILPMLERMGYDMDLTDLRVPFNFFPDNIGEDFLDDFGTTLRYYQVDAINKVINDRKGFLDLATSAGKTLITAGIVKVYDDYKSITIVPSEYLVNQTFKDVNSVGVDVAKITSKVTGKKREAAWNAQHLIITWQTLKNNKARCEDRMVVIYDEAHVIGDSMYDTFINHLNHAVIRIGMTGSMTEEKFKLEKSKCVIGGSVLHTKEAHELQAEGFISTVEVEMIGLLHDIELPVDPDNGNLDWEDEESYLRTNKKRIRRIKEIIEFLHVHNDGNFLILAHPEAGRLLAKIMGTDFIDKDTPTSTREEYFGKYDTIEGYELVASFGTVGTGVSVDNIQFLVTLDVGPNTTRIKQGIGRGLRKDGEMNHLKVFDIFSKLRRFEKNIDIIYNFGGTKHYTKRKGIYKKLKYPFIELTDINV